MPSGNLWARPNHGRHTNEEANHRRTPHDDRACGRRDRHDGIRGDAAAVSFAQRTPGGTGERNTVGIDRDREAGAVVHRSIQAPKGADTEDEAAEAAALAALAKLSEADAKNEALAKFPGATVTKASLGDENGSVVWEIQLTDSRNVAQEVKVDAGNGARARRPNTRRR